jgi:hypothetical protein
MVFNATFNNIQLYRSGQFYCWGKPEYTEKTTDLITNRRKGGGINIPNIHIHDRSQAWLGTIKSTFRGAKPSFLGKLRYGIDIIIGRLVVALICLTPLSFLSYKWYVCTDFLPPGHAAGERKQ